MATCNEVQFVQTQQYSTKWYRPKQATNGHTVRHKYTYVSQKQSYYKMELRRDFNYEMHRSHVRYRKTDIAAEKKNSVHM